MSSTQKKSVKLEQKPTPTRIEFIYLTSVASPKRPAFAADHLIQSRYANRCQENPDIRFGGRPCLCPWMLGHATWSSCLRAALTMRRLCCYPAASLASAPGELPTRPRSRHRTSLRLHSPKFWNILNCERRFSVCCCVENLNL